VSLSTAERDAGVDERVTGWSAAAMAAAVRNRTLDPVSLAGEHLRRIDRHDLRVGAFTAVRRSEALREAHELSRRDDLSALPLAGVPVAVKENIDVEGLPTTYGSLATSRTPSAEDDEIVRRLRRAGCIVIGKTRMPELAIWPFTEGPEGTARNPRNLAHTPGGSSGGSAAAVASGMAALAVGSDSGGSIRIPAACCGLIGVKPTPGLVPLPHGDESHWFGCSVVGPLARSCEDAALMLDALAGTSRFAEPAPLGGRLRISVSSRHPLLGAPVSSEIRAAVDLVADNLAALGHEISTESPPYPLSPNAFMRCFLGGIADDARRLGVDDRELESRTRTIVRVGSWLARSVTLRDAADYPDAQRLAAWMEQRDVLVAPILAGTAVPTGRWSRRGFLRTTVGVARWMGFCPPWNLAGCPAVAVPVMRGRNALPVGVQLVGPPRTESTLLSLASSLEPALRFR
jgi:amidase